MVLRSITRTRITVLVSVIAAAVRLSSGQAPASTPLTIEDIYSFDGWRRFNGSQAASMTWVPDGTPWLSDTQYLWRVDSAAASGPAFGKPVDGPWLRVDAASGASAPLYTYAALERALVRIGVDSESARMSSRRVPSVFNQAKDAFLINIADDLYVYSVAADRATRATRSGGEKTEPTFSPDGRSLAFIKRNNLYVANIPGADDRARSSAGADGERALTSDGNPELLNGILDWVYSEELYGRGNHRAYWWSPDSTHIAFLQLDETSVPEYSLVDDISYHPVVQRWNYPKAGDPNPRVRLGILPVTGKRPRWVDTTKYSDFLIVSVAWTPDSRDVIYQIQNRQQTWLDLNRADRNTGSARTLLRETSDAWVERWQDSSVDPIWLKDGSFLWLSERSGWRHFYHYGANGRLIAQITRGEWEVRRAHGVDPTGTWIYFSSTAGSAIGLDLYRIRLNGSDLQRLSTHPGRHEAFLNPSRSLYLDSWSDVMTPPQVRLYDTTPHRLVRIVDANPVAAPKEHDLSTPEFLQVKTRDGFVMEAMMIKPPHFDPARRYPVYQFTYAGPHFQQVTNGWGGTEFLYQQLLAQQGMIVWICDNRTASGKGMQSAWPLYKNFGELELRDIEDGIAWLTRQPYVDSTRIGIAGVSFGAYMTLYALTHSRSFAMGIAEGAVADWRNYDTIYTERYMGLPSENADGYRRSSPRFSAANLH
jgi:dipeptidyl-peptidase-4